MIEEEEEEKEEEEEREYLSKVVFTFRFIGD